MAAGAPLQPLVSVILLTLDQEAFAAEAVGSLFVQDYTNLEIVLSDHGSGDRTFAILTGLAANYRGPHRLLLNQSASTGGILGHFLDAVAVSGGDLIVMAAGDDISAPHRVSRLVEVWRETGAAVLSSGMAAMDEAGRPLVVKAWRPLYHDAASYFAPGAVHHLHGAGAAYDRGALLSVEPPAFPVFTEDLFLALMLGLRSARFARIDEPLVTYRIHPDAYTSRIGSAPTLEAAEAAMAERSRITAQILGHIERAALADRDHTMPAASRRLAADRRFHEAVARWAELGLAARLRALRQATRPAQRRWMLPRLFGLGMLARLKRLRRPARQIRR